MRNIKLVLEYDGTNYAGFQRQKNHATIQQVLEEKLTEITKETIKISGSGRTDAGVHALGQVINFHTESNVPTQAFVPALNSLLPKDIVVVSSKEVSEKFHARFSAKKKTYDYLIYTAPVPAVFYRNTVAWVKYPLTVARMNKAAKFFRGKHDFSAFQKAGSPRKTSVCNIFAADVKGRNLEMIEITFTADRFLYGMARAMAGFLIDIGTGKRKPAEIKKALASGDKKNLPAPAPACGLYLVDVAY